MTGEDLEAITGPHLYCVMLPKVQSPDDVVEVDTLLRHFERRAGVDPGRIFIDPALETAQGVRQAYENRHLVSAGRPHGGQRRQGRGHRPLNWLPMDARRDGNPVPPVQGVGGRAAAGIQYPMSGGWMDIHDLEGLRQAALQAKQLGYTGMHLIHPSHVPVVNEVFTPTPQEVEQWRGLIQGHGGTPGTKGERR